MVLPQEGGSTFVSGGVLPPPRTGWLDKPLVRLKDQAIKFHHRCYEFSVAVII